MELLPGINKKRTFAGDKNKMGRAELLNYLSAEHYYVAIASTLSATCLLHGSASILLLLSTSTILAFQCSVGCKDEYMEQAQQKKIRNSRFDAEHLP